MRMWKINILYIFLCLALTACAGPRFKLDEGARGKLSEMPGQIDVRIDGRDGYWHYAIVNGELLLHKSIEGHVPGRLEKQPYIRFRKEVPSWLPKIRGFEYYGPYRLSPDSSLMFLSLSSEEEQFYHPYFVIIQTEKKEAIFQGRSNNQIKDIAWSPDSNMFAVLDKSSRWSFGIPGILFYVLAHPIDVGKFYLSIYDWKGNLLVRTKVASGVLVGDGRVSWQGKK